VAVASVPLAWWLGWLSMGWLYVVGFMIGTVHTVSGTAAQIVLTQVVPRERLVEAHAKNALASSGAEVAGPGLAGALIKLFGRAAGAAGRTRCCCWVGADPARHAGARAAREPHPQADFWRDLKEGLRFVRGSGCWWRWRADGRLADVPLRGARGADPVTPRARWALSEHASACATWAWAWAPSPAACWAGASATASGPGPCLVLGFAICGLGWVLPGGGAGVNAWAWPPLRLMLAAHHRRGAGLHQLPGAAAGGDARAPAGPHDGTMRWLTLLAAGPGALLGGWLGEHVGCVPRWALPAGRCGCWRWWPGAAT
jgi:hypothetical protein